MQRGSEVRPKAYTSTDKEANAAGHAKGTMACEILKPFKCIFVKTFLFIL